MCQIIPTRVILFNALFNKKVKYLDALRLQRIRDDFYNIFKNESCFIDISDDSIYLVIKNNPLLFDMKGSHIIRSKFSSGFFQGDYPNVCINFNIPKRYIQAIINIIEEINNECIK